MHVSPTAGSSKGPTCGTTSSFHFLSPALRSFTGLAPNSPCVGTDAQLPLSSCFSGREEGRNQPYGQPRAGFAQKGIWGVCHLIVKHPTWTEGTEGPFPPPAPLHLLPHHLSTIMQAVGLSPPPNSPPSAFPGQKPTSPTNKRIPSPFTLPAMGAASPDIGRQDLGSNGTAWLPSTREKCSKYSGTRGHRRGRTALLLQVNSLQ